MEDSRQRPNLVLSIDTDESIGICACINKKIVAPIIESYRSGALSTACMIFLLVGSMIALFLIMYYYN